MSEVELSAVERLATLEKAAEAGEPVTAGELAAAREAVTLSGLVAKGHAARAEERRKVAAAEKREASKAEAAKLFEGHDEGENFAAYDAAVAAFETLIATLERGNGRIPEAARILRQGGVTPRGWDHSHGEGFDSENHAAMEQGDVATYVVVAGKAHGREVASSWVAAAVHAVAHAHGGLPLPHGGAALAQKVDFDKPAAIKGRQVGR